MDTGFAPYDSGISSSAYRRIPHACRHVLPMLCCEAEKAHQKLQSHEETQHRVAVLTMP